MSGWRNWRGNVAKKIMANVSDEAIFITLSTVGEKANQQVPLDEGTLQNSQFIEVKNGQGLISYGGGPGTGYPLVPYALKWHEIKANFLHGRKPRYLADPFNALARRTFKIAMRKEGKKKL